jgi:hypothetical protein
MYVVVMPHQYFFVFVPIALAIQKSFCNLFRGCFFEGEESIPNNCLRFSVHVRAVVAAALGSTTF